MCTCRRRLSAIASCHLRRAVSAGLIEQLDKLEQPCCGVQDSVSSTESICMP